MSTSASSHPSSSPRSGGPLKGVADLIADLGGLIIDWVTALGDISLFAWRMLGWLLTRLPRMETLLPNMYQIGVLSLPVVALTGTFIGMVLAVQTHSQFRELGLETRLGAVINMTLVRELGPVLAATMLAGRVGSAMAAELGTMRVTEQIDALASMGANPIHYLVVPRFLGCLLLIPCLTIMADFMGVVGGGALQRVPAGHRLAPLLGQLGAVRRRLRPVRRRVQEPLLRRGHRPRSVATAASTASPGPKASAGPRPRPSSTRSSSSWSSTCCSAIFLDAALHRHLARRDLAVVGQAFMTNLSRAMSDRHPAIEATSEATPPRSSALAERRPSAGTACCATSTWRCRAARRWSIIGESGCGKTVLLKTLIGLVRPTARRGALRRPGPGHARASKQLTQQRIRFGFLFQKAALFDSMTVAQNVAFPLRQHTQQERPGGAADRAGPAGRSRPARQRRSSRSRPSCPAACGSASAWRGPWR